jgi:hypothetical protein
MSDQKGQIFILLTALGGLFERVGKTSSIFIYNWLVCGFEFDHSNSNWLLA